MKDTPRFVSVPGDTPRSPRTLFRIVIGRVDERTEDGSPAAIRIFEPGVDVDKVETEGREFWPVLIPEEAMKSL